MTPVVYLHGFASSPASTKARALGRSLSEAGFPVAIPDLAEGHFERLTITGQLAVIERAAGAGPVSLVGSSLGGYLAALFAARHSQQVQRVVLMAPAFAFAQRWYAWLGDDALRQWRETGVREVFHYGENRLMSLGYQLLQDAEAYEDYPDVTQPTLIFHGSEDDTVPADLSREFARRHPNARLEILPSGHELTDQIDYMAPRILQFLKCP